MTDIEAIILSANNIGDDEEQDLYQIYSLMQRFNLDVNDYESFEILWKRLLTIEANLIDVFKTDDNGYYTNDDEILVMESIDNLITTIEQITELREILINI